MLRQALASGFSTSTVAHAAVRGIAIEALESELEIEIRVNTYPEDLPPIQELATFSPVFNTLTQRARVLVDVQAP